MFNRFTRLKLIISRCDDLLAFYLNIVCSSFMSELLSEILDDTVTIRSISLWGTSFCILLSLINFFWICSQEEQKKDTFISYEVEILMKAQTNQYQKMIENAKTPSEINLITDSIARNIKMLKKLKDD